MQCPRCEKDLFELVELVEAGTSTEADRCTGCGGTFFHAGRLKPIESVVKVRLNKFLSIPSERTQLAEIYCPLCGDDEPMMKMQSERDERVTVDICPKCRGTWLDAGELAAIQEEGMLQFFVNIIRWFHRQ